MTRRPMTFRCPEELALRLEAAANSDPTRPSVNQLMAQLLEQALDSQQQGKLDQILDQVTALRDDLDRARRLRAARDRRRRGQDNGTVLDATILNVPPLMHGQKWNGKQDLAGWLVSEKLDGCRAYWDGSAMWTRSGRRIHPPARITDVLPNTPLDGEIWAGRGNFNVAQSAVKGNEKSWEKCEFMVFDAPGDTPLLVRLGRASSSKLAMVGHKRVETNEGLLKMLANVVEEGGEGLVAREPTAPYVEGRQPTVLKIKQSYLEEVAK